MDQQATADACIISVSTANALVVAASNAVVVFVLSWFRSHGQRPRP